MMTFDAIVLYVENTEASKTFYTDIFDCQASALSPTFVSFTLPNGLSMALKQRDQASSAAKLTGGGTELSFVAENAGSLYQLYEKWKEQDVSFLQTPTELVFGLTFVATDPDGHRIRVFTDK